MCVFYVALVGWWRLEARIAGGRTRSGGCEDSGFWYLDECCGFEVRRRISSKEVGGGGVWSCG